MLTEKEFIKSFEDHFCDIEDHRQAGKIAYPLIEMFFLGVVAVASHAESWQQIEAFGEAHLETLQEYLPFENGAPSDCTIRRFFTTFDPNELNKILLKYFGQGLKDKHFAIDGKTLRGSKYQDQRAFHFLNVYASESGITLFGKILDSKENEITAIPEAIECLDIKGGIVTVDAMGCQKTIAKQIIDKEADYIFGLKGNHATLYHQVEKAFQTDATMFFNMDIAETYDKGHGRIEYRKCRVIHDLTKITECSKWAGIQSVIEVRRVVTEKEKISESTNYYISSSAQSAEAMLKSIRSHWAIESMHWILDVVFHEDKSGIRMGNAPANMAIIRRFVLNILTKIKQKRETRPLMMFAMGMTAKNVKRFADVLIKHN